MISKLQGWRSSTLSLPRPPVNGLIVVRLAHVRVLFTSLGPVERSTRAVLLWQPKAVRLESIHFPFIPIQIISVRSHQICLPRPQAVLEH